MPEDDDEQNEDKDKMGSTEFTGPLFDLTKNDKQIPNEQVQPQQVVVPGFEVEVPVVGPDMLVYDSDLEMAEVIPCNTGLQGLVRSTP